MVLVSQWEENAITWFPESLNPQAIGFRRWERSFASIQADKVFSGNYVNFSICIV
jgi:hypothetical protein